MSGFETAALSDSNTGGSAGGSAASASSPASGGITVVGVSSAAEQAPAPGVAVVGGDGGSDSTPLSAEETAAVFSEQPTGDVPSASEMEDRKDATSSSDNLLPTDKLQNGLKNAKMIFATGWASVAATYRDLERTETAEKMKEGAVALMDRSMDGLSKVGCKISETTEKGVQVVGSKMEEAAPTLGRWRDEVYIASERGYAAAKDMTDKAIAEIKKPGGSNGGVPPNDSGDTGADDPDGGAHTV
ncbi:unnamed protein product [Pylaiella littoralis]